jgi:hypothetical protein
MSYITVQKLLQEGEIMKNKFNKYTLQTWGKNIRGVCRQLIIPFAVFQGIRTIFFPTTFDVLLLAIFILVALGYHYEWF